MSLGLRRMSTRYTSSKLIIIIVCVSVQYGEILHECAEVFSRAVGKGKYYTRVQCLAILDTNLGNERFLMHLFVHCCLPNNLLRPYPRRTFLAVHTEHAWLLPTRDILGYSYAICIQDQYTGWLARRAAVPRPSKQLWAGS